MPRGEADVRAVAPPSAARRARSRNRGSLGVGVMAAVKATRQRDPMR